MVPPNTYVVAEGVIDRSLFAEALIVSATLVNVNVQL